MEVSDLFRRALCVMLIITMLAAVPQTALALTGSEALFGGGSADTEQNVTATRDPNATLVPAWTDPDATLVPAWTADPAAAPDATPVPAQESSESVVAPTVDAPVEETEADIYGADDNASASRYPTLKLGDRDGEDAVAYIVFLQNRLIELDYLRDSADGVYGENTETAVKAFQKNNGLDATGVADPQTQEKLFSDISTLVPSPEDSTMFGGEVTRVQTMLAQWGFLGGAVDGQFGNNTSNAIVTFKNYMVDLDPKFGVTPTPAPTATPEPSTIFGEMPAAPDERIMDEGSGPSMSGEIDDSVLEYVDGEKSFNIYRQTVRSGDNGSEVLRVQTRLHNLKYLYRADGEFGALTENALIVFQRKNGLAESGIADQETQMLLFSARAIEAEEYVFPYKIVVDIGDQRVYVGKWTGDAYTELVKEFKCSTGKKETPTPLGTFQMDGKAGGEWYYFKDFNCYAKWATRIVGGILFHSITFNSAKRQTGSEHSLGRRASHGCVRLKIADAKWIYDNCPAGTTVVIQD